ncbi:MAG: nuclear transport factor 2 family protein, partial [Sphingobacteriaceae bacterium]
MTPEEQIIICENRLFEAMKMGDTEVLNELIDDSIIFNIPSGQTITKAMDLESYRSGILTIYDIFATDQVMRTIENISTVAVTVHLKAKYADQIMEGKFRYLRVWKMTNYTVRT